LKKAILMSYLKLYGLQRRKREKSQRTMRIREILYYLCPESSILSRGDALSKLVKCKSMKSYFQSNFPVKSRHIGFQRCLPDMSVPQPGHVPASIFFLIVGLI
jgi:hypothetical protein